MEPFGVKATLLGSFFAILLGLQGQKKKSLTATGSIAAVVVGFLSIWTGLRGFNLLVFYKIGTTATKYKKDAKEKMDGSVVLSGTLARGPSQVLACSALSVTLGLIHGALCGAERAIVFDKDDNNNNQENYLSAALTCGMVAHHATCLADTLASELGILSKSKPVLITQPWKTVPPGTNGGVSLLGFVWSALGGLIIGLSTICFDYLSGIAPLQVFRMVAYASTCGLLGSLIDSLLGATIQQTYWDPDTKLVYQANDNKPSSTKLVITNANILNNEQVNLVSVALTTFLGGWILGPLFFGA